MIIRMLGKVSLHQVELLFVWFQISVFVFFSIAIAIAGAAVICAGFLVALGLFGFRRYFSRVDTKLNNTSHKVEFEKQEMEWDNSALNITVNPLDVGQNNS